jgi:hypothetical protein
MSLELGKDVPKQRGAIYVPGLLLEEFRTGRRYYLGVDGSSIVCDVACRIAGSGNSQSDWGTGGERWAADQRRCRVFGGYDVCLHSFHEVRMAYSQLSKELGSKANNSGFRDMIKSSWLPEREDD